MREIFQADLGTKWVREKRNGLLANSDWTVSIDSPLPDGMKRAWSAYRQQLRDMDMEARPAVFPDIPCAPIEAPQKVIPVTLEQYRRDGQSDQELLLELSQEFKGLSDKVAAGAATKEEQNKHTILFAEQYALRGRDA